MARELLLPELAESVVEGEILKWLVNEGDDVKLDQPVVEVMTDKVTVELPSPFAGKLQRKLVKEGDVVPIHAPIAVIDDGSSGTAPVEEVVPPANTRSTPREGEVSAQTAQQVEVSVEPQRRAEAPAMTAAEGQPALGGEMSATESAVGSNYGGPARTARVNFGKPAAAKGDGVSANVAATNQFGRVLAVPAARQLARDHDLDIAQVPGSGPNGRVGVDDVRGFVAARAAQAAQPTQPAAPELTPTPPSPAASVLSVPPLAYRSPRGYEHLETRVPLRGLRRAISTQMLASHLHTVRTLTVDEVDLTALVAVRARLKPQAEQAGVKLSYLPFIFKALASALQAHPSLNSSLDETTNEIVQKHYYNLGCAVATEAGLVVPVVKDVDRKSVLAVGREINELASRAREGKLSGEDVAGSSFSVTNIGSIGALFSFPIINVPDAAILGVHSLQERPVVRGGEVVVRSMMYLSLSFDHRLVDGAEAARFTRAVIRLLENPDLLILEAI